MLEVNIYTFGVLVELSDFDAEVLVEGPLFQVVLWKVNTTLKYVYFLARVLKIKYLSMPEENKTDAANNLQTRLLGRTHLNLFYCI